MKNIALISPNNSMYSETFIQQHRNNLKGNVLFYFNGFIPKENDVEGNLASEIGIFVRILRKFKNSNFSLKEYALIKSFKKQKIDIVVAEYGLTAVAIANVCKYLNIPLVPIFHGQDASDQEILRKNETNYKELFRQSPKLIAVSKKIAKTLIELGCPNHKIQITPCAPDDNFFNVNPLFKSKQFIGVGRFVDKKAPYYTILAFNLVLKEFQNAKLILIGQGPLYNTCENLIKYLNIENNVILKGIVSPKEIEFYFENSICFVQHSVTALSGDSEGTPVSILEANAAGLPIVSTKHSGISDVVINGETGYLVDEHDVEGMAQKMILILSDLKKAKSMGLKGKNYIKSNFSKKIHIDILDNMIHQILAPKKS